MRDLLPKHCNDIFVDASTDWGIGGCCGKYYFQFAWAELGIFHIDIISRKELFACLISLWCFAPEITIKYIVLYTDNSVAARWLSKGRSKHVKGNQFLACFELQKYKLGCKISPRWLPGSKNYSADDLSRNKLPDWLRRGGVRRSCDLREVAFNVNNAEVSWNELL